MATDDTSNVEDVAAVVSSTEKDQQAVSVGEFTWEDYFKTIGETESAQRVSQIRSGGSKPPFTRSQWEQLGKTKSIQSTLGFHPAEITDVATTAAEAACGLERYFKQFCDPDTTPVRRGEWLWEHYKRAYYYEADGTRPRRDDGMVLPFSEREALGIGLVTGQEAVDDAAPRIVGLDDYFEEFCNPHTTPVVKDIWMWEHYKRLYYYNADGSRPRDEGGEIIRFEQKEALGFDPNNLEAMLSLGASRAEELSEVVDERTVNIQDDIDEDTFFSDENGITTVANRYDLEKAVPMAKKLHFKEIERYWVNKPYAFIIIFHSQKENEKKYYVVEPYQNSIERDVTQYLTEKLRTAIKYREQGTAASDDQHRLGVITDEAYRLLERYSLYSQTPSEPMGNQLETGWQKLLSLMKQLAARFDREPAFAEFEPKLALNTRPDTPIGNALRKIGYRDAVEDDGQLDGIAARPEPAVLAENSETLTEYQVEKLLYILKRDFIGYERIDPIKHDINVEDISCDGYNSPVFVYHSEYEQLISNITHGEKRLDDFVVKLAQRSGKGISKRRPQVDATLPDGSRAQLTLGREVSDHGTNYTIRQFKEVPFTPIDLINWHTFSLEEMAYLWLCIENNKSLIFAGGTASGKTTSLNAVSLFIPSNSKIVSIEDTREVELPQRNWIASVTRPSFSDDDKGDVDEFDLLEAALRQRPDYIVMGEIRGEEGRTLFQVMSTGHTTYTTFHADTVGEVLKRFTTEPINVSKTMFTALDLVSIQTSTRVQGKKVRRNKSITEINHYDAENDEINVQDVFQWQAETDEFLRLGTSNTLESIKFDRGWTHEELKSEQFQREVVLAYLIDRGLNTYTQVAATIQAFMNDPDTILALMANDELEASLEDLREMESVLIDIDPDTEALVPRPDPGTLQSETATRILKKAEESLFPSYRGTVTESVASALKGLAVAEEITVTPKEVDEQGATGDETATDTEPDADADMDMKPDSEADRDEVVSDDAGVFDEYLAADEAEANAEDSNMDERQSEDERGSTDADDRTEG